MHSGHAASCLTVVRQQLAGRVGAGHGGKVEDGAEDAGRVARAVVVRAALPSTATPTRRRFGVRPLREQHRLDQLT